MEYNGSMTTRKTQFSDPHYNCGAKSRMLMNHIYLTTSVSMLTELLKKKKT